MGDAADRAPGAPIAARHRGNAASAFGRRQIPAIVRLGRHRVSFEMISPVDRVLCSISGFAHDRQFADA